MPFTLAHPAIVLPLRNCRFKFSLTGLILGSIIPDFEFFIQMREVENIGHHAYGILLFDLPMAVIMSYLFHNVLRNTLIANLPWIYKSRFIEFQHLNWNTYARNNKIILVGSILIGVLSHQGWDAFTHHDGLAVQLLPALSSELQILNTSVPVYYALQILFSLIGLATVQLQVMQLPMAVKSSTARVDYRYWVTFGIIFFAIVSLRLVAWPQFNSTGGIAIAIMGALLYSWFPATLFFKSLKY